MSPLQPPPTLNTAGSSYIPSASPMSCPAHQQRNAPYLSHLPFLLPKALLRHLQIGRRCPESVLQRDLRGVVWLQICVERS